ncbi:hypothetical protein U3516DRAFT_751726 [Neocallimastix sp. 'constans']
MNSHNHLENKFEAAKSVVKNKIKDEISNNSIPFNANIKCKYDEISLRYGSYMSWRNRRKQLSHDITTFDEIPYEPKYYKTKRDENFMIFKNHDLIYKEHNYVQFFEFLEYFKKAYLISYETESWNYYDNI